MAFTHEPVMLSEVLEALGARPGMIIVDGTVGLGGHATAVATRLAPDGVLLGIDKDPRNVALARERLSDLQLPVQLIHDTYLHAPQICYDRGFHSVDGILLDLGYSSVHVEDAARGFSFQHEGPLDMRYDPSKGLRAEEIVNSWNKDDLAHLFRTYGEEPMALRAASAIVNARRKERLTTTTQLAEVLAGVLPRRGKIHPATRVFQALRIAVNDELGELTQALPELIGLLKEGGRLAVITFHSLEDRLVKQAMKDAVARDKGELLTKHVMKPTRAEVVKNPRARSAKLRVFVSYGKRSHAPSTANPRTRVRTHERD